MFHFYSVTIFPQHIPLQYSTSDFGKFKILCVSVKPWQNALRFTTTSQITLSMARLSGYFCQSIYEFRWCLVVEKSLMAANTAV